MAALHPFWVPFPAAALHLTFQPSHSCRLCSHLSTCRQRSACLFPAAGASSGRLRELVEGLLLRQLCGWRLLAGNFVAVPLLGQQVVLQVAGVVSSSSDGNSGDSAGTVEAPGRGGMLAGEAAAPAKVAPASNVRNFGPVTLHTKVHLLSQEEAVPATAACTVAEGTYSNANGGSSGTSASYAEAAAAAAAAAEAVGGESAHTTTGVVWMWACDVPVCLWETFYRLATCRQQPCLMVATTTCLGSLTREAWVQPLLVNAAC